MKENFTTLCIDHCQISCIQCIHSIECICLIFFMMKYLSLFVIIIYCMTITHLLDWMIIKMNKTDGILTVYFYISVCSSISTEERHERKENDANI